MRKCWGIEPAESAADDFSVGFDLTSGGAERYVLWILRRLALCAGDPGVVERSLSRRLGAKKGREAYLAMCLMLYAVCLFGRRPLRVAPPSAVEKTRDEALILQLLAAAQHGGEALVDASLLWLVDERAPIDPRGPVRRLAQFLSQGGMALEAPNLGATRPDRKVVVASSSLL